VLNQTFTVCQRDWLADCERRWHASEPPRGKLSGKLANATSASGEFPQIEYGYPLYISVAFAWFDRPVSLRQPGGSIKVETVNSSPARFGENSANFLRMPKAAK